MSKTSAHHLDLAATGDLLRYKAELAALAAERNLTPDHVVIVNDLLEHGSLSDVRSMVGVFRDTPTAPVDHHAAELERLKDQADPATAEALARLRETKARYVDPETGEVLDDVANPLGGVHLERSRQSCRFPIARTVNGAPEVLYVSCHRRGCPTCGKKWGKAHIGKLMAATCDDETLSCGLVVAEVPDAQMRTVTTGMRRRGCGWQSIPIEGDRRLIITDDETLGDRQDYADAIAAAEQALDGVRDRAKDDKRQVSTSKSWKEAASVYAAAERDETDDDVVWLGILTRAPSQQQLAETVERFGGKIAPVAPLESDPDDALRWRIAHIPAEQLWKVWAKLGLRTFDEMATAKAERKADDLVRHLSRRRELVAA